MDDTEQFRDVWPSRSIVECESMLNLGKSQRRVPCSRLPRMSECEAKRERVIQCQRPSGSKCATVSMRRVSKEGNARRRQPGGQGSPGVVGEQAHTWRQLSEALYYWIPVLVSFPKELDIASLVPGDGFV